MTLADADINVRLLAARAVLESSIRSCRNAEALREMVRLYTDLAGIATKQLAAVLGRKEPKDAHGQG